MSILEDFHCISSTGIYLVCHGFGSYLDFIKLYVYQYFVIYIFTFGKHELVLFFIKCFVFSF